MLLTNANIYDVHSTKLQIIGHSSIHIHMDYKRPQKKKSDIRFCLDLQITETHEDLFLPIHWPADQIAPLTQVSTFGFLVVGDPPQLIV